MARPKECEMEKRLISWLRDDGWDVYREISPLERPGNDDTLIRADIVAAQNGSIWAIEVKTAKSRALLGQCLRWREHANMVSAAAPSGCVNDTEMVDLKNHGIGLIGLTKTGRGLPRTVLQPATRSIISGCLASMIAQLETLPAEYRLKSGLLTPVGITCANMRHFVVDHPGCTLRDFVESKRHHYDSKKAALANLGAMLRAMKRWIGIRCEFEHGCIRLFPVDPDQYDTIIEDKRASTQRQFDAYAKEMSAPKEYLTPPIIRT